MPLFVTASALDVTASPALIITVPALLRIKSVQLPAPAPLVVKLVVTVPQAAAQA